MQFFITIARWLIEESPFVGEFFFSEYACLIVFFLKVDDEIIDCKLDKGLVIYEIW